MRGVTYAGIAVLLALLVTATGFATDPASGDQLSPVPFDETLTTGLTGVDIEQAEAAGHVVPKGQVFYSQYQYVVGYDGVDPLVAGIAWLGASGAYLALVLDLLTPVEVLVPVLAFAVGYRALLGDRTSGELATLRTYPISSGGYAFGVSLGRAVIVLGVVLTGLLISAAARSSRGGLAMTTGAVIVLVVGLNGAVLAALTGGLVAPDGITHSSHSARPVPTGVSSSPRASHRPA